MKKYGRAPAGPQCIDCGAELAPQIPHFSAGPELGARCHPCHFGPYVVFCPRCKWRELMAGPAARELEHTICLTCEKAGAHIHFERLRQTA